MIIVFYSVLPAAAYEPLKIEEESDAESVKDVDMYMFAEEDILRDPNEDYFKMGDVFFIDENGGVCFDHEESSFMRSECKHSYKAGILYVHKKKGNGCSYIKYSVKRCSKCAAIKDRKYLNTITYAICPHK